jgi:hypothetical protein
MRQRTFIDKTGFPFRILFERGNDVSRNINIVEATPVQRRKHPQKIWNLIGPPVVREEKVPAGL